MTAPIPEHTGTELEAATAAARRVVDALLAAGGDSGADLAGVADRLHSVADDVRAHAPDVEQRMDAMWRGENRHGPATGSENALAPPMVVRALEDGTVEGAVTLGLPYQGPPGAVHGGVSALLLDHALGVANHVAGRSGMTAELTLRYRRTVPLFRPLTVTAGQVSVHGREIRAVGEIRAEGTLRVSAEGLFRSPRERS